MILEHYSAEPLGELRNIAQTDKSDHKPMGLWLSVPGKDDWPTWCRTEEYELERLTHVARFKLAPAANVLIISDGCALDQFNDRFGDPNTELWEGTYDIRWFDVAAQYDGIIIAPYRWSHRLERRTRWYYGWDCASGCIWNPAALERLPEPMRHRCETCQTVDGHMPGCAENDPPEDDLPEGVFEHDGKLFYTCRSCEKSVPLECDLYEFDPEVALSHNLKAGDRVVATHPSMGRDYATVAGDGSRPETIMINVEGRYYNPQEWPRERVTPTDAQRDMVPGDLLDIGTLKAIFEQPFLGTLWTEGDSGMLTPYVCECSFGDGLKLIKIFTINQRPNYHVVRVDSSWNESNWHHGPTIGEHIDDVLQAIEEECGPARPYCEDCETNYCDCDWPEGYSARKAFPALDDENGCSWAEVDWKWLMREVEKLP